MGLLSTLKVTAVCECQSGEPRLDLCFNPPFVLVRLGSWLQTSILFSDVVGFTKLADLLTIREVVLLLNNMFTLFDRLVDKHEIYKVETIGVCTKAVQVVLACVCFLLGFQLSGVLRVTHTCKRRVPSTQW